MILSSSRSNFRWLEKYAAKRSCCISRLFHRVVVPIEVYRGFDDVTDRRIAEVNQALGGCQDFSIAILS